MKIFDATLPNGQVISVNAATAGAVRRLMRETYRVTPISVVQVA